MLARLIVLLTVLTRVTHGVTIDDIQHTALMELYDANPLCTTKCVRFGVGEDCPTNVYITCVEGKGVTKL